MLVEDEEGTAEKLEEGTTNSERLQVTNETDAGGKQSNLLKKT